MEIRALGSDSFSRLFVFFALFAVDKNRIHREICTFASMHQKFLAAPYGNIFFRVAPFAVRKKMIQYIL